MQIVPVHRNISAKVTLGDKVQVQNVADEMQDMMARQNFPGKWRKAFALHHSQVEAKEPLNFFVVDQSYNFEFHGSLVVVNPKYVGEGQKVWMKEACMSLPFEKKRRVKRYEKIAAYYEVFGENGLEPFTEELDSLVGQIFQHEVDHANAIFVYD